MTTARKLRITVLLLALVCTVGCDQTTKHFARAHLHPFDSIVVLGGCGELRLAENPGGFLSLGATLPAAVRTVVFTIGVCAGLVLLCGYLARRSRLNWLAFAGLSLAMAGGMSNLIDRFTRHGMVTDFITLRFGHIRPAYLMWQM